MKTPQNHHKLIKTKIPKKFTNKKVSCRLAVAWLLKTPQNPTKPHKKSQRQRYRYLHTAHAIANIIAYATIS
ncbi:hypothetical protein KVD99_07110 [Helicobacter pylori]|nr:hypothetical protein KVD99_07110 [Helicobacter pylori]